MYPKGSHPIVSVVICALNEEKNLPQVLCKIPDWVDEVILMDGHSTDDTVRVAKELRSDIKILYQPTKGKGEALKYGVLASRGDIIVTLDADGTYPPEEMSRFVEPLLNGYDFAKGSRFIGCEPECMPNDRKLGNKILALATNFIFRTRYTDVCSGYYAFYKRVFREINLQSNGFEMEQELFVKIVRHKYNVVEVSHSYKKRMFGESKTQNFRQGFKDLLWIVSLISQK